MKVIIWDPHAQKWGDAKDVHVHSHETVQQVFDKVIGKFDQVESATFVSGNFCGSKLDEHWNNVPSFTEVCIDKYPKNTRFAINVTNALEQRLAQMQYR